MDARKMSRIARHERIRKRLEGTGERPRLAVFRSSRYIYVQVIDDVARKTLAAASDLEKEVREAAKGLKKRDRAKKVGTVIAKRCLEKGIANVVFDRAGFMYHGRVSALADAAREGGLKF